MHSSGDYNLAARMEYTKRKTRRQQIQVESFAEETALDYFQCPLPMLRWCVGVTGGQPNVDKRTKKVRFARVALRIRAPNSATKGTP
jgi:hypothetical protein